MRIGLITYLRTESVSVSRSSRQQAADYIARVFGPDYLGAERRDPDVVAPGHEAIRPTRLGVTPADLWRMLEKRNSR